MNMLRSIPIIAILLTSALFAYAQPSQPGQGRTDERMQALESRRVAFITERMGLTPREARLFWPIYNEYNQKVEALNNSMRNMHREMPDPGKLTEEQAAIFIEKDVERLEQTAALRREYHEKLKEVIPARKIALLYEAEKEFNRVLFRESQQRMHRNRP